MKRIALLAIFPLIFVGLFFTAFRYMACIITNTGKAWNIALMVDETCNVDANGKVNETISERAAKAKETGRHWGCILCRVLDAIQSDHCAHALADEPSGET